MTLAKLAVDCLAYLGAVQGYAPGTLDGYRLAYDQFRAHIRTAGATDALANFTDDAVLAFAADLGRRGVKPNTIIGKLSALSTLAQYAMTRKLLKTNPTKAFDWPTYAEPETKFLYPDEFRAWLAVPLTKRAALVRDVLVDTALRASELCRLNVEDVIEVDGKWCVATTVKGRGKRRRKVHVPISTAVAEAIREALLARGLPPMGAPLLVSRTGGRLTRSALGHLVARTAEAAELTRFTNLGPHTIRHTVNVVRKFGGMDDFLRSKMLGQSDPRSQHRYNHLLPGELHSAKAMQDEGMRLYLNKSD